MKKRMNLLVFMIAAMVLLSGCNSSGGASTKSTENNTEPVAENIETGGDDSASEKDNTEASENDSISEENDIESEKNEKSYEITYQKSRAWTNSIETMWIQTIIEITNTGDSSLFLDSGAYDLEDADGKLITSRTMVSVYPQIIEPGEKAYYYEETTLDDPVDVEELVVIPRPDIKKSKTENIKLTTSDVEIKNDEYSGVKMIGRVENNTDEVQNMVYVSAILYDSDGNPIGQIFTILMEEINPGDKIGFEASAFSLPDDITAESVANYEIFAYPSQYQF